ncbi:hypothetical protein FUSNEC_GEN_10705_04735 [Fusobacterium necrophorum subsp. funduliforme]
MGKFIVKETKTGIKFDLLAKNLSFLFIPQLLLKLLK